MPDAEGAVLIAGEWVVKAEDDLKNAVHTLKLGPACPTGTNSLLPCSAKRREVRKGLFGVLEGAIPKDPRDRKAGCAHAGA
jgi:hypothetical protein